MHTVMIRVVVLFYVLLSGLCALTHAAEQTITRTVEEFTLGMPTEQALAVVLAALQHHHMALVDQTQPAAQELMERVEHHYRAAGRPPWIVPTTSDILFTLNAVLFDDPVLKDPVVNVALAAQIATSPALRSPTAQSIGLVFYQAHMLGIFVTPLATYDVIKPAFLAKYGSSQASVYHKNYGFDFVQGDQWIDTNTIVTLTVDNGLFYADRALYALLKEEAQGMLKGVP